MNKTAIEWCDLSWNPVTGCKHGCPYCYARKIAERFKGSKAWPQGFEPTYHAKRLFDPEKQKTPQTIFVCSMADIFGSWLAEGWINTVMTAMLRAPGHTYILLTKNPNRAANRLPDFFYQWGEKLLPSKIPHNWWIGASVESSRYTGRIDDLRRVPTENLFVSFEPLLGPVTCEDFPLDLTGIKQVIIGAQTNPFYPVQVSWIKTIEDEADRVGAKVFVKDSLKDWMSGSPLFRRELAWPLNKSTGVPVYVASAKREVNI
jgi:protein gp37